MARAGYITRKDGRYWFQKRLSAACVTKGSPTHLRISLRTAHYGTAVRRMLRVACMVQEYESDADFSARAEVLLAQLRRFNMKSCEIDEDILVERRGLEVLVSRFISEARAAAHPLTTDPAEFWPHWISFVNGNVLQEKTPSSPVNARSSQSATGSRPLTVLPREVIALPIQGAASLDSAAIAAGTIAKAGPDDGDAPKLDGSSKLSELRAAFLLQRRGRDGDGRAEEDYGIVIRFLIDMVGDKRVAELGSADLLRVENALPEIPHRKGIPKESVSSLFARWCYARDHGWDGLKRLSRKRIKDGYHRCLHAFLNWIRDKSIYDVPQYRFELTSRSNGRSRSRDAWTPDEIVRLFSLPLFTGARSTAHYWKEGTLLVQNYLYWAYVLIFFVGMRPSEMPKLKCRDLVEMDGVLYFDLREGSDGRPEEELKTDAAFRLVPLPRIVIDLGLVERRDDLLGKGKELLFPDWPLYTHKKSGRIMYGHAFSKSWQYIKTAFGFDREDLTLYGGRHTRATWYDELNLPRRIRIRVLGHAPKDVADEYGAKHVTHDEAKLLLSRTTPAEEQVADLLLTAKIRAELGELKELKPWLD